MKGANKLSQVAGCCVVRMSVFHGVAAEKDLLPCAKNTLISFLKVEFKNSEYAYNYAFYLATYGENLYGLSM